MSSGRSGKLTASLTGQQQQQRGSTSTSAGATTGTTLTKPHVPPLWRENQPSNAAPQPANPNPLPPSDPRSWTWESLLDSSHQHGTSGHPYRPFTGAGGYRSAFEPSVGNLCVPGFRPDSRVSRMKPPLSSHIGLLPEGEMMGAAARAKEAENGIGTHGTAKIKHTQRLSHTHTTTTTITHTETTTATAEATTTAEIPIDHRPRAVGDGGAMLSYGSDDGPSRYTTALLPALRTSERDELKQLSDALEFFVSKLDTQRMAHLRLDDRDSVERLMDLLKEEQGVYDLFFDEVIRQVSTQCKERGELLGKIREYYANLLLRVPLHLYSIQSELSAQQKLNATLQAEQRVMREQSFAIKVELGAYTHRFKEVAHEMEMHKDMLSRAEHEKDRARAMFTLLKEEWDHQRHELEEQLAILKEEREDYLSTASATATALQKSRNPNLLVHSLLDDSDSDEERINARLAFLKDMAQDDDDDLLSATVLQIERDQAKASDSSLQSSPREQSKAQTRATGAAGPTPSPDGQMGDADRLEQERREHIEAARKVELIRRDKERAALMAAVSTKNPPSSGAGVGVGPTSRKSISSSPHLHHGLSSLPDFAAEPLDALLPDRFKRNLNTAKADKKPTKEELEYQSYRRLVRAMRKELRTSKPLIEAQESERDILQQFGSPSQDELIGRILSALPSLAPSEVGSALVTSDGQKGAALLIDFLARVEEYPFNQAELLLLRAHMPRAAHDDKQNTIQTVAPPARAPPSDDDDDSGIPAAPVVAAPPEAWRDGVRDELSRRGLHGVVDCLFSHENESRALLVREVERETSEGRPESTDDEQQKSHPLHGSAAHATLTSSDDDLDTAQAGRVSRGRTRHSRPGVHLSPEEIELQKLAHPSATRSARSSMKLPPDQNDLDDGPAIKLRNKLAREERRRKKATGGVPSDDEAGGSHSKKSSRATGESSHRRGSSLSHTRRDRTANTKKDEHTPKEHAQATQRDRSNSRPPSSHIKRARANSNSSVSPSASSRTVSRSSSRLDHTPQSVGAIAAATAASSAASTAARIRKDVEEATRARSAHRVPQTHSLPNSPPFGHAAQHEDDIHSAELQLDASDASDRPDVDCLPSRSSGIVVGSSDDADSDASASVRAGDRPSVSAPKKDDLASRRATLPAVVDAAASLNLPAKPPQPSRPKSIQPGLTGSFQPVKPAAHSKLHIKAHHRHHSRADNSASTSASAHGTPQSKPRKHLGQETHPILTLSHEHAQAANDPRANDDDELVYRSQNQEPDGLVHDVVSPSVSSDVGSVGSGSGSISFPLHDGGSNLSVTPISAAAVRPTPIPRRDVSDPSVPRSFFEASQIVPVSKILVAPPKKGHIDTPRERELQLVIQDLIAQNELLHAQRQALAQLHGVQDTGAAALPATLGNWDVRSEAAQQLLAQAAPEEAIQKQTHTNQHDADAPQQTMLKQNQLLAKVNEYLHAYRQAKKAAAPVPESTPDGSVGSDGPVDPLSDAISQANNLARNVTAGQKNLMYNSRFLSLLKSSGGHQPNTARNHADGERKEPSGVSNTASAVGSLAPSRASSRATGAGSSVSAAPGSSHVTFQHFSLAWLIKWLRGIYDAKLARDDICRKENAPLQRFPEFLLEVQRKQFGLDSLTQRKTWDIIQSLAKFRDQDREISVFMDFLEESRGLDELILFLRTRAVVYASTVGVRWPGHLVDRGNKSCAEYISLCRARDVISSIFNTSVDMQDSVYRDLLSAALTWNQLPDPISKQRWDSLLPGRNAQVDERCVLMIDFLERMLNQFRAIELQLRHQQWAEDLFNSAVSQSQSVTRGDMSSSGPVGEPRMDFASFQQVFSLAEPKYSSRDIAQLYSNVTRNAGLKTISKPLFKRLIHQLMNEGVMFPLLKHAGYEAATLVRMVIRHWNNFKEFFHHLLTQLSHSDRPHDVAAANNLRQIRFALEKEIARAASGQLGSSGDPHDQSSAMSTLTRRLVSIYRGMLNVISSHQSAFMLVPVETPIQILHTELKSITHIILQRHRLHDTNESRVDSWLESISALDADERLAAADTNASGAAAAYAQPQTHRQISLPSITNDAHRTLHTEQTHTNNYNTSEQLTHRSQY